MLRLNVIGLMGTALIATAAGPAFAGDGRPSRLDARGDRMTGAATASTTASTAGRTG